jgi:hypothetical protein
MEINEKSSINVNKDKLEVKQDIVNKRTKNFQQKCALLVSGLSNLEPTRWSKGPGMLTKCAHEQILTRPPVLQLFLFLYKI